MKIIIFFLTLVLPITPLSFALAEKNNIIKNSSIFIQRPIETWKNEKFIFHTKPLSLRKFYYPNIVRKNISPDSMQNIHPPYEECAGRIGTIEKIIPNNKGEFLVTIKMDDTGAIYDAESKGTCIDGLIALKDIANAQKSFMGKSFYYLDQNILTYNEKTGEYKPVYAKKYSCIKIIGVEPGLDNKTPVRLLLETNNEQKGFIDINLSGTNVPKNISKKNRFYDYFSMENPESWTNDIKNLIEIKMVKPGMTISQARMSWGEPDYIEIKSDVATKQEKWIYPYNDTLFFENGILKKSEKSILETTEQKK
ncbi:conserved hypothetical protein, secreted [Candidatus Omnitrophus magneticus]|uniref:Uncharacterized protein n=1 Tax=Candidatus Omnitrophus magneticus TaxID=1609969 RepID=A0A0F0CP81_9BACT|nr:conserved hypothetical protein, secreted [Candidatus Omnitrophus magneticus]